MTEPGRGRQLAVRRSKRKALSTIFASRVTADPAELVVDLTDGSRRWPTAPWGASVNWVTDPDNSGRPHRSPQDHHV